MFGHLIMSQVKETLIENMSKYQIATKPGHRASEHLYVIKSLLSLIQMKKKAMIISMWDLKTFFDTENLYDCMNELYRSQIKGKMYRLMYKMNQKMIISIKTPLGKTESKETDSGLGQGTVEGAIVSSVSLDNGVTEEFSEEEKIEKEKEEHKNIENLPRDFFHPCIYVVDVAKGSSDIASAQDANNKMENVVESKLLTLNLEKTTFLVVGNEKARRKMLQDLVEEPLTICGEKMKYSESEKISGGTDIEEPCGISQCNSGKKNWYSNNLFL